MRNVILGLVLAVLALGPAPAEINPGGIRNGPPTVTQSPQLPLVYWGARMDALEPQVPELAQPLQADEIRFTDVPALFDAPVTVSFVPNADGGLDGRPYRRLNDSIRLDVSLGTKLAACTDGSPPVTYPVCVLAVTEPPGKGHLTQISRLDVPPANAQDFLAKVANLGLCDLGADPHSGFDGVTWLFEAATGP